MSYTCPLCHALLVEQKKTFCCSLGHQFDKAKEGYVNLLPVHYKRSKDPGDNGEMMQARRAFLTAGYYQPLRDTLHDILLQISPVTLLDIGCGEGYYTAKLAQAAQKTWGVDVSKVAIRYAAKSYPQVQFCVASSHRLPFSDNNFDAIVRIFAPCKALELARVLKPGGIVLTVTPGPQHLMQLKALIYRNVMLHDAKPEALAGFDLQDTRQISWEMALNGQQACALLQMTPFAWKARPEIWDALRKEDIFRCETDFTLRIWQRQMSDSAEMGVEDLTANPD